VLGQAAASTTVDENLKVRTLGESDDADEPAAGERNDQGPVEAWLCAWC
jgi:hypothetical protein